MNRTFAIPEALITDLLNYLACCVETNKYEPDESTPLLAKLSLAMHCEVVEIEDTDAYSHVYAIVRYEPE